VTNPRRPFRLNVGFLINQPVGYSHEFLFDFPKIQIADDLDLSQFNGVINIGHTPQGLLIQGDITAQIKMECVRCLNSFEQHLHWKMTELYAFSARSVSESGLIMPEDAHIDLQPLIREYALLEAPISPICKTDCRGLCPVCGENLNRADCGHRPQSEASQFSILKDLLRE
jgi:uncharacterized protein